MIIAVGRNFGEIQSFAEKYLTFESIVAIIILLLERLCHNFAHFEEICRHSSTVKDFDLCRMRQVKKTIYYLRRKI